MLTTGKKANLLEKRGIEIPSFPARTIPFVDRYRLTRKEIPDIQRDADREQKEAVAKWEKQIEALYAAHFV